MSHQDPTTSEKLQQEANNLVHLFLIPGFLGMVAATFVAYVLPVTLKSLLSGNKIANAITNGLTSAGERLTLFLDYPGELATSLGFPMIGLVVGIIISIAKQDD